MTPLSLIDPAPPASSALRGLRVAIYASGGSAYHHAALAAHWGAEVRPLSGTAIREGALRDADVLVMPGGGALAMTGLLEPLGDEGADAVRGFVERGGAYIGSCAGSFLPARVGASFWEENPVARRLCMVDTRLVNASDGDWAGLTSPGVGTIVAEVGRPGHWLARGMPPRFHLVHYNGPMFDASWTGEEPRLGRAVGVVRFAARTEDFTPGERFMEEGPAEPCLFDHGVKAGAHTALAAEVGEGLVVLFGSHPEFGIDPVQLGWVDGVRLFENALCEQARRSDSARRPAETGRRWWIRGGSRSEAPDDATPFGDRSLQDLGLDAAARFEDLRDAFTTLASEPWDRIDRGSPLPAFMGRTAQDVWSDSCAAASRAAGASARQLRAWADRGVTASPASDIHSVLATWLGHEPPAGQDYGFAGLLPLLDRIAAMLQAANQALRDPSTPDPLDHAYDGLERHPYQLAASSYLSAAGLTASATLVVATLGTILGAEPEELRDVLWA